MEVGWNCQDTFFAVFVVGVERFSWWWWVEGYAYVDAFAEGGEAMDGRGQVVDL